MGTIAESNYDKDMNSNSRLSQNQTPDGQEGQQDESEMLGVSEYELWLVKKDFEAKIKKEMMDQVIRDYAQMREIAEQNSI